MMITTMTTTITGIQSSTFLILKNSFSNRFRKILTVTADYKILGQKIEAI